GRKEEAIRDGVRCMTLLPLSKDAINGAYQLHQLVRIYILAGEPEKALDHLETLIKVPYFVSPAWLKIDPNFDPIRNNPRFQRLVAGAKRRLPPAPSPAPTPTFPPLGPAGAGGGLSAAAPSPGPPPPST